MGVWPLLGALVELLDDDHLLPRLAALEDNRDLVEYLSSACQHKFSLPQDVLCRACRLQNRDDTFSMGSY